MTGIYVLKVEDMITILIAEILWQIFKYTRCEYIH